MPSASEIHATFSRNLRQLVAERGVRVASLCRAIGVNRTQFNRYLSGQTNPRPEVLHRICSYFGVDGRIILEPLDQIREADAVAEKSSMQQLNQFLVNDPTFLVRRNPPPSGIHTYWQTSSSRSGWANSYTVRIFEMSGATVLRGFSDKGLDGTETGTTKRVDRHEIRSLMVELADGLIAYTFLANGDRASFSFFNHPLLATRPVYPGVTMFGRPVSPQVGRIQRCALEILPQDRRLLECLRQRGGKPVADLAPHLQDLLISEVC
ncbi:helix-turn-helix domain-containing protein [Aliiroseovarius sp. CAU 1755]